MQERKLDRVAAAYAVAGWLLVQGASIVLPTFSAPDWALKVVIIATLAGLPIALLVAWQMVPHPYYQRDLFLPTLAPGNLPLLILLGVLIALVAGQFAYEMGYLPGFTRTEAASVKRSPGGLRSRLPPQTSIAVLPFLNLSGDPHKEYFSDGISEELLNDLSNAPNLRVAARTSSFAFKEKSIDIRNIAHALNVRTVLEGSVREDGQRIRITAQLIDAADGFHLWSRTYDRDISNVLVLQDDIAREITAALTHRLLNKNGGRASVSPIDPEAYRKYLEARSFAALKTDEGDARAIELFKQVTVQQPDFASAFAALGRTYVHVAQFHDDRSDALVHAGVALNQALKLDSRNPDALAAHLVLMIMKWNWTAASYDALRLASLNPHNAVSLNALSFYYMSFGFPEKRAASLREAIRLDPLSFVNRNNLADVLNDLGKYGEAALSAQAALALRPGRPLTLLSLCWADAGSGRYHQARTIITQLSAANEITAAAVCGLKLAHGKAETHKLAEAIAQSFSGSGLDEVNVAKFYAMAGDLPKALSWLDRAYNRRIYTLFSLPFYPSTPAALLNDVRWKALLQRPEARRWQAARELAGDLSGG